MCIRDSNIGDQLNNNYLKIKLLGSDKNYFAIGAKVTLFTNGHLIIREQYPVRGFQSSVDPILHFGIDTVSIIDSIQIQWPSGRLQKLNRITANQVIEIKENADLNLNMAHQLVFKPYLKKVLIDKISHKENESIDFLTQPLLPRMYSTQGPAIAKGDIDGDQLNDIFIGGGKGFGGIIYLSLIHISEPTRPY